MAERRVMVINSDTAFLNLMNDLLSDEGYHTTTLPVSDQAYELVRREKPDLVFLDVGTGEQGKG